MTQGQQGSSCEMELRMMTMVTAINDNDGYKLKKSSIDGNQYLVYFLAGNVVFSDVIRSWF